MKKTLVDLIYVAFPIEKQEEVPKKFYSTFGFLDQLGSDFGVYFLLRTTTPSCRFSCKNIRVVLSEGKSLRQWQIPLRFNAFVKSLRPDYVLAHGFSQAHYLIFLKLICPKTKILLQANGFAPKPNAIKSFVYKIADRFIDGYLFTGVENAAQWYNGNILKKEKIFEVMEGSVNFQYDAGAPRTENSFLWVGRLDKNKDPMAILEAFLSFSAKAASAKLTMVFHEGHLLPVVEDFIARHENLKRQVDIKGFLPHEKLEAIYNSHRYFVLGSHYEGSGYALVEAMACGCVPVITNIPSFRYMTNDGDCALLFPPGDVSALAANLDATQGIDFSSMQQKVLQQFEKRLSFRAIAERIRLIFENL